MERGVSTVFHYFPPNSSLVRMVPDNLILDGCPCILHEKLDKGAKCASLVPVKDERICKVKLCSFVNLILRFRAGYTLQNLLSGALRPMADAMGATLVLYALRGEPQPRGDLPDTSACVNLHGHSRLQRQSTSGAQHIVRMGGRQSR